MPTDGTRADSLQWRHTGAATHEAAQATADNSLGKHIAAAANEIEVLSATRSSPITGDITVDYVGGANGEGSGTLAAKSTDSLAWTAPGGTEGTAVTILNGETKILEDGADPTKYVRVSRTSTTGLSGSETVVLADPFNNAVGFDNVSSAEATAGDNEYRCLGCKNRNANDVTNIVVWVATIGTQVLSDGGQLSASGAGTITTTGSFADWPESGFCRINTGSDTLREIVYYSSRTATALTVPSTGRAMLGTTAVAGASTDKIYAVPPVRIGIVAPDSQPSGEFVDNTAAGEGTAPSGIVFSQPITQTDGLSIGTLTTGQIYGLWIHREVPASQQALASILHHIKVGFDAP